MTSRQNKKLIQAWVDDGLAAMVDGEASRLGISRSELIARACREFCESKSQAATKADLAALAAKLDALEAQNRAAASAIAKAIESQPIAVQALPAPKREKGKKGKKKRKKKR